MTDSVESATAAAVPQHVAIIMDGNGRWAQARGKPRTAGHERGADAVRATMRAARRLGIPALTLYAFSEQNWDRPEEEVNALVDLLCECLVSERDELVENEIRLSAIGRLHKLPKRARAKLRSLTSETAPLGGMTLTLALSYGGREEILDAARELASGTARWSRARSMSGRSTRCFRRWRTVPWIS